MPSASSWSWVTIRKVMPTRSWMPISSRRVSSRSLRSSAANGSSSSSSFGNLASARAKRHALALAARQLRWPAPRVIRHLDQCQHLLDARGAAPALHALLAQAEGDVGGDVHMREQRIGLEHHVDRPRIGRQRGHVVPSMTMRPLSGVSKPAIIRSRVVLPQPDGPEQREELAALDRQRDICRPRRLRRKALLTPAISSSAIAGRADQRRYSPDLSRVQARVRARS